MTRWRKIALVLYWLAAPLIVGAAAQIIGGLPFTLTNGTVADATQVMANFNQIVNNTNANSAKNGVNSDITALSALVTPLTVTQGGTGLATLTSTGILYGNGTGTVGSARCTMDANSSIACTSATTVTPLLSMLNSTADANSTSILFQKNRTGGNSGNADTFGSIAWNGFANAAQQPTAKLICAQNGAAVGSNIPSLCSMQTSTTAGQLNIAFIFPATSGTAGQYLTASGSGVTAWATTTLPTVQRFTSGTAQTYTAAANVKYQRVRIIGPGGGGGAQITNAGSNGTADTSFQVNATGTAWVATKGSGGTAAAGAGGAGGTLGSDGSTGSKIARFDGADGFVGGGATAAATGAGGASVFGGAGPASLGGTGQNAKTNTGSGGAGGSTSGAASGSGGGAGEYVEFWVTGMTTATYTVGLGGAGGTAGTRAGGNGAAGIIIVEEFYQ